MPWGVEEGVQSRQRELSASAAIAARRDELHEAGNLLGGETRSANDGDVGVWKILCGRRFVGDCGVCVRDEEIAGGSGG